MKRGREEEGEKKGIKIQQLYVQLYIILIENRPVASTVWYFFLTSLSYLFDNLVALSVDRDSASEKQRPENTHHLFTSTGSEFHGILYSTGSRVVHILQQCR